MTGALLGLSLARAEPLQARVGDVRLSAEAALGARVWVWVGEDADTTRYDPVATEGVGIWPLGIEGRAETDAGLFALLRLEEGVVHAGAVEAAEARLGWEAPAGFAELWVGRGDLPVTRDRAREPEDLALGVAPLLSRASLPWHATGVGGGLAWPDRAILRAGLAWTAPSSDAPFAWTRLDLHPLGPPPDDEQEAVESIRVVAGAGLSALDSPSLGRARLINLDTELRFRALLVSGGWTGTTEVDPGEEASQRAGWQLQAGTKLLNVRNTTLHAMIRGERLVGVEEGEDVRWLGDARLSLSARERAWEAYVELLLSREQGDGVAEGEDVVVLGRGVERSNDALALGLSARLR